MLDPETKARIDSARDILVGKVPDPKSQVEQITIALIYKFMDDMDRQSEELGGKASFFTGDFKKYRWAQLLDKRFGGHERLLLYAEGIEKMNENKNTPQLFRDIFRGVFLPYRDPETLNLFLKEIDGFIYDHSERLGDAFEYLLSVLGTQGDAGQFRTPRHIIDFIVAVVDPKKHETVLDPACGTAGFLVSAYKHILNFGSRIVDCGLNGQTRSSESFSIQNQQSTIHNLLTPDERARLMSNFRGYDIAPDMVRLSRVNMYLHGFPNPIIHEYDTLTSEERWDERCDVILANPPFMTPKGGIRPHNRFSITAKRSEVLFVDYIAEHLNTGGRAGVIVPEGIIFQSQNAYKALRKMLVENYLWAVVSLPAGVFNPYSGVKTSILFFDKNFARRADEVLFVKIEHDGFDLGAQRRPNGKSDLPEALQLLIDRKAGQKAEEGRMVVVVPRTRLLESPDINLSGDRYRLVVTRPDGKWPLATIEDVCTFEYGSSLPERSRVPGPFPVVGSNGIAGYHNTFTVQGPAIVIGRKGSAGEVTWINQDCLPIDTTYFVQLRRDAVSLRYLFYALGRLRLTGLRDGAGVPGLNRNDAYALRIPLPPLVEQERIVAELEGYRKVIEGARQIIASYRPTIQIDPAWPVDLLGAVANVDGILVDPKMSEYSTLPHVSAENIEEGSGQLLPVRSAAEDRVTSGKYIFEPGCVLYSKLRPYLRKATLAGFRGLCSADMYPIRPDSTRMMAEFLLWILLSSNFTAYADTLSHRARMPKLNRDQLLAYEIPLPPLDIQRQIVAELEAERKLVEANRELVIRMEAKIRARLDEVWGKE